MRTDSPRHTEERRDHGDRGPLVEIIKMNTSASAAGPGLSLQQQLQQQQRAPVAPAASGEVSISNGLKEWIAAILSLSIVGFTLWFMVKMFGAAADVSEALWQHQSAILQVAIGLAGTVTGYYFGRIPAERAAANSQQAANSAQQNLASTTAVAQQAAASEQRIRDRVNDLRRQVSTPMGGGAGSEAALRSQLQERLDDILRG